MKKRPHRVSKPGKVEYTCAACGEKFIHYVLYVDSKKIKYCLDCKRRRNNEYRKKLHGKNKCQLTAQE